MTFNYTYTFTNGTLADADQVNQNFDDVEDELNGVTTTNTMPFVTVETTTDSTEYTLYNTSWTTKKSVTFTAPFNCFLLGVTDTCDVKTSSSVVNNLIRITCDEIQNIAATSGNITERVNGDNTTNYLLNFIDCLSTNYTTVKVCYSLGLPRYMASGDVLHFNVQLNTVSSATGYIKNQNIRVCYSRCP